DDVGGLEFKICQNENKQPVIEWLPEPVLQSADDALETEATPAKQPARDHAKSFLIMHLRNRPQRIKMLREEAAKAGIADMTLNRAAKDLGIKKIRSTKTGTMYWKHPKSEKQSA